MQIEDRAVLITGANRGIGRAFVTEALARGARKVYAGVRAPEAVDAELAENPRVELLRMDITEHGSVRDAAETARDTALVINNAGVAVFGSVLEGSMVDARRVFETNVFGTWAVARSFASSLKEHRGALVNVVSAISWFSPPQNGAYAASKAAQWSLTNSMRLELAPHGVLVQGVHFGAVDTDFAKDYTGPKITADEVATMSLEGVEAGRTEVLVDEPSRLAKAALTDVPDVAPSNG
ncbi:SDR family oxidoreductase [Desertihabitans aurantiacus]|uniref:SDR family oxidoreductase n=1 Tax=Desertihabitans aurantiacus TaxID=2282477 RepID=UPI000DF72F5E|nr:SDR family oxidoreductase [Desertihabitans aurantiacus]